MKPFVFCVSLLVVVPMAILNPMGRSAFLGYYTGAVATLIGLQLAGPISAAWDRAGQHPTRDSVQ